MPVRIRKSGKKFLVTDPAGKVLGEHPTRKAAAAQTSAVNIALARKRGIRIPKPGK